MRWRRLVRALRFRRIDVRPLPRRNLARFQPPASDRDLADGTR